MYGKRHYELHASAPSEDVSLSVFTYICFVSHFKNRSGKF